MKIKYGTIIGISILVILIIIGYTLYQDPESRFFIGQLIGVIERPGANEETTFQIEAVVTGIPNPTTMAFLDDDIIYLEKNTGKVRLIQNGKLKDQALLDFNVNDRFEGGLLGVVVKEPFVYFYLTEAEEDGGEPLADRVYKFFWDGQKLVDSKLIHSFNVSSLGHHGGAMTVDNDGIVYLVRGDQRAGDVSDKNWGILQNYDDSIGPDDTSVIIILEKDESVVTPSKTDNPFAHYYGIGIRNSFGITFDPITNNMWITENGPENFDEINLVQPKFNSGWSKITGPANQSQIESLSALDEFTYSDPEFSWEIENIAPTALEFVDPRWPKEYENSLFVGMCQRDGFIFNFELNPNRDGFIFESINLKDKVVNPGDSMNEIILFSDFTCVTDLEFGPDGSLYVVSYKNNGAIYKITPISND